MAAIYRIAAIVSIIGPVPVSPHVLEAMGCARPVIGGALRFSFAATNTLAEIDKAIARLLLVLHRMRHP